MSAPYDVAIVGCGPVGALAANLCGRAGLRTIVVERESEPHPLPRAVHFDHEMMRLFQTAGVIERVLPRMRDTDGHVHIGADGRVLRYMGTAGMARPYGWANDYFFYQPEIEDELRRALVAYPHVVLRFGVTLADVTQDANGASLSIIGAQGQEVIHAKYLIGCDGARSATRKALGVDLDDLDFDEPWLVVDAEVDGPLNFADIGDVPSGADLQRLSIMMCDPTRPATIVPGRGNHRRWEFMLLPGETDAEMMRAEKVNELIRPWVKGVSHRVVRAATYRFHGLVAKQWRVGRAFLAGDAAHQTPPFFGQGLCHGFRDVANLIWKLELVLTGRANEDLLATYQSEREAHVRSVIGAAVETGRYICVLDPAQAAKRDAEIRAKKGPATAGDIIPPLTTGVVGDDAIAGARFIQPRSDDRLLDDITGQGWRAFAKTPSASQALQEANTAVGVEIKAFVLQDLGADTALAQWLDKAGVDLVIVRPDHYVFGGAAAQNVPALVNDLAAKLTLMGRAQATQMKIA